MVKSSKHVPGPEQVQDPEPAIETLLQGHFPHLFKGVIIALIS